MSNKNLFSMNLYDLNKSIIGQLPKKTKEELIELEKVINDYHYKVNSEFYMLLCKDISYYTIFHNDNHSFSTTIEFLGEVVIDCASNVGSIISIDPTENNTIEIWVKTSEEEVYCMYLFDAKDFVVKFLG